MANKNTCTLDTSGLRILKKWDKVHGAQADSKRHSYSCIHPCIPVCRLHVLQPRSVGFPWLLIFSTNRSWCTQCKLSFWSTAKLQIRYTQTSRATWLHSLVRARHLHIENTGLIQRNAILKILVFSSATSPNRMITYSSDAQDVMANNDSMNASVWHSDARITIMSAFSSMHAIIDPQSCIEYGQTLKRTVFTTEGSSILWGLKRENLAYRCARDAAPCSRLHKKVFTWKASQLSPSPTHTHPQHR